VRKLLDIVGLAGQLKITGCLSGRQEQCLMHLLLDWC